MSRFAFLLTLSILSILTLFPSCVKDDETVENPGELAGLGDQSGDLQGAKFSLPSGIELNGKIMGLSYASPFDSDPYFLPNPAKVKKIESQGSMVKQARNVSSYYDTVLGSGYYVMVLIPLKNTTNQDRELILPARLIIKAKSSDDQNGILLKETKLSIPAGKTYNVALCMYCGNLNKNSSSSKSEYEWGVISNSSLIKELTDILADRKINIEEFTSSNSETYYSQISEIQDILWSITDSNSGLSNEDKTWLKSLPKSI